MVHYLVYTDGGCRNTGVQLHHHVKASDKSAYAYLLVNTQNGHKISGTNGFYGKTNNQMEVSGVIAGLSKLLSLSKSNEIRDSVMVVSDSRYVDNAFNKHWINGWQKRNYKHVKNASLWKHLYLITTHIPSLKFKWVKGHYKNKGNIFVDHKLNHTMDRLNNER